MSKPTSRPLVPALVLCFLVLAFLSPPAARASSGWDEGGVSSWVGRLWGSLSAVWGEEGCIMDPDGRCRSGAAAEREIGCGIDGNGSCRSGLAVDREAGCDIDGNGGCKP